MCRGVTSVFWRAMASARDLTNPENLAKSPPGPILPSFAAMSAVSLRNSGSARSMCLWKGVWSDLTLWQEYFLTVVLQLIYRFLYVH
jgi:hypothetical protein